MKMNLEIFRQITFSNQFITKCRPLIKYNPNTRNFFEKELVKNNFEESLKLELDRYEKIRKNVDNRNPNTSDHPSRTTRGPAKRKQTMGNSYNNDSNYY